MNHLEPGFLGPRHWLNLASILIVPLTLLVAGQSTRAQVPSTQVPGAARPHGATPQITTPKSIQVNPQAAPVPSPLVTLSVSPNSGKEGDTFKYTLSPPKAPGDRLLSFIARLQYRFVFDDGTTTPWSNSLEAEHQFAGAGVHAAYAEIGSVATRASNRAPKTNVVRVVVKPAPSPGPSAAESPSPSPSPSQDPTPAESPSPGPMVSPSPLVSPSSNPTVPPTDTSKTGSSPTKDGSDLGGGGAGGIVKAVTWAIILLGVALVAFVGYRITKWVAPARPTLVPHTDPQPDISDARQPLAIEFQLLLNSSIPDGEYRFQPDDQNLIDYLRREND